MRSWLGAKIETALAEQDCRFLLLTAEPGAGKTVLMAWLTDWLSRECSSKHHCFIPRYFIRRDSQTPLSSGDAHSFLFALGHQLAALHPTLFRPENLEVFVKQRVGEITGSGQVVGIRVEDLRISPFYKTALRVEQDAKIVVGDLEGLSIGHMVAEKRFLEPENLQYLALLDPANLLLKEDPNARIVILIDALDELRYNYKQNNILNWLAQCPELPSNVRFVLTSRPEEKLELLKRRQEKWLREEMINLQSEQVQTDLHCYAEKFISQEPVKVVLTKQQIAAEEFTVKIVTKADGNFQYMAAFFRAIEQAQAEGKQEQLNRLLKLAELPAGLQELYAFFLTLIWDSVQEDKVEVVDTYDEQPAWEWLYQPILGILSIAREPLKATQIANLGRIKVENRWLQTALGRLGQFLDQVSDRYRLYHTTFPEFLTSSQTETNYPKYYLKPLEWHGKIVAYYRDRKAKWDDVEWTKTDNYGLLYLPIHLYLAEKKEELYTLLTGSPKWMEAKSNTFGNAAYVDDLKLAIDDFATPLEEPNQLVTLVKLYTALQVVNQRVSISNLRTLVHLGREVEARSYARLSIDSESKFNSLLRIHYALQELGQFVPGILNEAEDVVNGIREDYLGKAEALIKLSAVLVEVERGDKAKALLHKAAEIVEEIRDDYNKAKTLIKLAAALAYAEDFSEVEKVATKAEKATSVIVSYRLKAELLGELAKVLKKVGCGEKAQDLFNEALKVAGKDEDRWGQADALIKLAINLDQAESNNINLVFKKVELVADEILTPRIQVDTLIKLAITLAQTQRKNEAKSVLDKVVKVISTIDEDDAYSVYARSQFAVALAHIEYFSLAEKFINIIQDKGTQVEVLSKLAVLAYSKDDNKAGNIFNKAEEIADQIEDGLDKVSALSKLANALEEVKNFSEAERIAIDAEKVARATKEGWRKPDMLIKLATILVKARCEENKVSAIFREAEKVACSQKKNLDKAKALSKLAVALVQSEREAKPILTNLDEVIHEILDLEEKTSGITNEREKFIERLQEEEKIKVLIQLTQSLAQAQNFSKAEKIATLIQDDIYRSDAFSKLAVELARHQDFSKADKIVQAIEYKPAKAWALSKLAVALADAGNKEVDAVFNEAMKVAFSIEENISKQRILIELVADLAQSGELAKAREIVNSIEDNWAKAIALSKLARAYALTKNFTEAKNIAHEVENIASTIERGLYHLWIISELTITLAHVLLFNRALSILGLKETPSEFLTALMEWLPAFEHIKPGIIVDILQESIHIFTWEHLDWYDIDTIFLSKI